MTKENQLNSHKIQNQNIDYIKNSIETFSLGKIVAINEDNISVKMSYKLQKNNNIKNEDIIDFPATNFKFCLFPYEIGDLVLILFPRIQQDLLLDNNTKIFNLDEENSHTLNNGIILFNLTKADLTNKDTITIPFGDFILTINKDGSLTLKNSKITINFDKEGNIKLDNQKGQIKLDNQGQITIKNNQAMLNIDQTGLFSIQNIAQTMSLFTILNVDLVKVLTNLTPSSGAFAQALAQYEQDLAKLLK